MTSHPYQDITPAQLDALGPEVRRIDVREPHEYTGPLGHLSGAELVPLGTLEMACASWPHEAPLLLICRSGGRSAKATLALAQRGFKHLYNLAGGIARGPRDARCPVPGLSAHGPGRPGAAWW